MSPETFSELLQKYLDDNISPAELSLLLAAARKKYHQASLKKVLEEKLRYPGMHPVSGEAYREEMFSRMLAKAAAPRYPSQTGFWAGRTWLRYAAALLLFAGGAGTLFYALQDSKAVTARAVPQVLHATAPGREGAILILDGGKKILMDTLPEGTVATRNGTRLVLGHGRLTYHQVVGAVHEATAYHTVVTPRGRQFLLQLSDGTSIWLNAASSIRFPTRFAGKERRVALTGEAFLEVAKNARKPFVVNAGNTEIQVLGTRFNLNAYTDEQTVKATLLEGKIRIVLPQQGNTTALVLKPGEQARILNGSKPEVQKESRTDTEEAIAWKNGIFRMQGADLSAIMRQVSRWYDVEVAFRGAVPAGKITGEVPRSMPLQQVLEVIKASGIGVSFRWEGRTLVVLP